MLWTVAAVLAVAAVTALVAFPLGIRWGVRMSEHRTEREVVQAVLWAQTPMEVLHFYARYQLAPPDLSAYNDDKVAQDPALDRLTRRPDPVPEIIPPILAHSAEELERLTHHADPATAALARFLIRPAAPEPTVSQTQVRLQSPSVTGSAWITPLADGEPNPATDDTTWTSRTPPGGVSHHQPVTHPVREWLGDQVTAFLAAPVAAAAWTRDRFRNRAEPVPVSAPPAPPVTPSPPPPEPAPPVIGPAPPPLLELLDEPTCGRCKGTRQLHLMGVVDTTAAAGLLWRKCPDCCCPEPNCREVTAGGRFCPPHQDDDDLREEAKAKRYADV